MTDNWYQPTTHRSRPSSKRGIKTSTIGGTVFMVAVFMFTAFSVLGLMLVLYSRVVG